MLGSTIAPGTDRVYAAGWRSWLRFCSECSVMNLHLNPPEHLLCAYVAWLAKPVLPKRPRGVAVSTVKSYLAGIAHAHAMRGLPSPTANAPLLRRVLKGHMRLRGIGTKQKRPITVGLLFLLRAQVDTSNDLHRTVYAAMCVGVHGLVRLGELLPKSDSGRTPMTQAAVYFAPGGTHATLFLPVSKTDPFGAGTRIHLFASHDATCPIAALHVLLDAKLSPCAPLIRNGNKALSRDTFITSLRALITRTEARLKIGLCAKNFAGHSMRRGGATSLANRGAPEHFIQWLGRWKSDTYRIYIDYPPEAVAHWLGSLSRTPQSIMQADINAALRPSPAPNVLTWLT